MSEKTFKVAGVATDRQNNTKIKYANSIDRIKVLQRNQYSNINLIELDDEYDKFEICQLLLTDNRFIDYVDIINNELDRIKRLSDEYSVKIQKKQRKLALMNITANDILEAIK